MNIIIAVILGIIAVAAVALSQRLHRAGSGLPGNAAMAFGLLMATLAILLII